MKKALAMIVFLIVSSSAFSETRVEVTPEYDASKCIERKFSQAVNTLENIKTMENAETVTLSFDTRLFRCSKEGFVLRDITNYKELVIFNEGINLPWAYEPEYKISHPSSSEAHVVIEFKKSVIFKKKHERIFSYHFRTTNPKDVYYLWNIHLVYERGTDTTRVQFLKN